MKRVFCLIMVFAAVFAVSCSKKKSHDYEERVSKKISAEEGGTVESSDGKTSVEIPAGALDSTTTITMTIYDAAVFPSDEGEKIVSKVVEFEPSGTIFKKPIIITMATEDAFEKKILTAAVFKEAEGRWSYEEHGTYAVLAGREAGGDPIMQSAGGDPIMLNAEGDPIMMSAGGDPIMMSAAGDPIMLASAGDPIMSNAAGDPIMNAAAGDPIMMTTGHFTAYTFIVLDPVEDNEVSDLSDTGVLEPEDDTDTAGPDDDGDTETAEPDGDTELADDDVVPEPEPVYSKVLCTNSAICMNDEAKLQILCPKEGEDFYGQDAQYATRKGCVAHHSYTDIPNPDDAENTFIKDNATGLTWWFTGSYGTFAELQNGCSISYGGIDDWRLPTPKEILTLADHGRIYGAASDPYYIYWMQGVEEGSEDEVAAHTSIESYQYFPYIGSVSYWGYIEALLICVSGDEYGKINPENYIENGDGTVFDSSTNLLWQKNFVKKETWKEALAYCENLEYAGFDDWRLPNKNELVTLIDYSKADEDVVSSFPGFTTEEFFLWSSTTTATRYDPVWSIEPDGHVLLMGKGDYWEPGSVRCVRSALDEKEEIPECDGSGIGSCRDASSGIVWSSRLYPEIFSSAVYTGEDYGSGYSGSGYGYGGIFFTAVMCRNLNENGSNKWRIPTIDELRTIIMDEDLKTAGDCGYYETSDCESLEPSKTALNDFGVLVSGSMQGEGSDWPMFYAFDVRNGNLPVIWDPPVSELVIRCVYDEGLDFKSAPYTDPDTGFTWSEMSQTVLTWEEAQDFCSAMNYDDQEHYWRLPTSDELETLNKAGKGTCTKYGNSGNFCFSGEYSIFGDIEEFWTGQECSNGHVNFNFWEYTGYCYQNGEVDIFKARCVSDSPSPCAGDPCAAVENSTGMCIPLSQEGYKCECEDEYSWTDDACLQVAEAG